MKKRLVIFGVGDMAQLAYAYFSDHSEYKVVAFSLDAEFIESNEYCGLPLIPLSKLAILFPADEFEAFVALGYSKVNALRKAKYLEIKSLGYKLASFVSPRATCLNSGVIGENSFIFEDNTIQPFVRIGDNVTLWSGNHIGHHSVIGNNCFIASQVVISGGVEIGENCFIGVNATIRDHVKLGRHCVIGAGALIQQDAADFSVYVQPAAELSRVPSNRLRKI